MDEKFGNIDIYILRITRNPFRDATALNSERAKRLQHSSDYPLPLNASCVLNTQRHFVSSQKCCPSDITHLICTALPGYINFAKKF